MPRPPHPWRALVCLRSCYIFTAQRGKKITEESESISEAAAHFFSSATCRINTPFNGLLEFVSLYIFKERKKIFICSQQRFTVPHNAICFQGLIKKDLQNILSPLNISSHCTSSTSSLFLLSLVTCNNPCLRPCRLLTIDLL